MCPEKNKIKALLVDDHPVVRAGLKQLLEQSESSIEVAEAGSAQEALDLIRAASWDIVILDLSLPDKNGMWVLKKVKQECCRLPVLIISAHADDQLAVPALKAGAAGYVNKAAKPESLLIAVRKVLAGRRYISSTLAERLAAEVAGELPENPHDRLSRREFEILRMIGTGLRSSQIAAELCLSPKTIQTYRARVLEKMGLKTTADLIRYAQDHRLVE